jgi:predicted nucleotidyltransferase
MPVARLTPAWLTPRQTLAYNADMKGTQPSPFPFPPRRSYRGPKIPMRVIRRYARAIAEEFQPDKIILFGSFAYGTPHEDSDVDLLLVMPARDTHSMAVRIRYRLAAPFPLDLLIRTPKEMKWRLEEGESFLTTIMSQGKVLYEKVDQGVGQEGRAGLRSRRIGQQKQKARS